MIPRFSFLVSDRTPVIDPYAIRAISTPHFQGGPVNSRYLKYQIYLYLSLYLQVLYSRKYYLSNIKNK